MHQLWWYDTSALAQRRRALQRWGGSGGKAALTVHDARVRQCWRLRDEGRTIREIASEVGWRSTSTVAYHLHRERPPRQDVALSEILQRRDEAGEVLESAACSMPMNTTPGRWWRLTPLVQYTDAAAWRARDGTWRLGPYTFSPLNAATPKGRVIE